MDLHKELNAQQAALAQETLDGAAVYGLAEADRPRVAAFMAGLNRTARLKGDHPGLGTTATRTGEQAGDPERHRHHRRARDRRPRGRPGRQRHLHRCPSGTPGLLPEPAGSATRPTWETARSGALAAGARLPPRHRPLRRARTRPPAAPTCEFLGSRLVFLIDWNRARKQLRAFLRGRRRLALLRWAADQEVGHRGFLELGGAKLVNQAIEATAGSAMHFGDRLCDVLGVAETEAFLRFVFHAATDGLLARALAVARARPRPRRAAAHFSNEERRLLQLAADHAGLMFELACAGARRRAGAHRRSRTGWTKLVRRAARFEHDADQLVDRCARRGAPPSRLRGVPARCCEAADDAADELEDAVFLLGCWPPRSRTGRCSARVAHAGRSARRGRAGMGQGAGARRAIGRRPARPTDDRRFPDRDRSHRRAGASGRRRRAGADRGGGAARGGFPPVAPVYRARQQAGGGRPTR